MDMLDNAPANSNDSSQHLVYPDRISQQRIEFLVKSGIPKDIASVDLEMVKMKLADSDEGLGWESEQCDSIEVLYKRYLTLCKKYGKGIVPTKEMDQFWHYHILDTRAYCSFCDDVFGRYFHHYPYFGMRGEQDEKDLMNAFLRTKELYSKEFGDSLVPEGMTDCWHDCQGRCHNACKSVN